MQTHLVDELQDALGFHDGPLDALVVDSKPAILVLFGVRKDVLGKLQDSLHRHTMSLNFVRVGSWWWLTFKDSIADLGLLPPRMSRSIRLRNAWRRSCSSSKGIYKVCDGFAFLVLARRRAVAAATASLLTDMAANSEFSEAMVSGSMLMVTRKGQRKCR